MAQKDANKRKKGTDGVKALIATASVAATLVGWALVPTNDPPITAAANNQANQPPAINMPGPMDAGSTGAFSQPSDNQGPATTAPDSELPQVDVPQGFSRWPAPFTRTHSSR